jgi:hypothetical protein
VICLSRSWMRPQGCHPLRTGALPPVPPLLRPGLREPAGERDDPCPSPGTGDKGEARRERGHDEAVSRKTQGGMHRKTYERLWWEHHEAETDQLEGMKERLDKLEGKAG